MAPGKYSQSPKGEHNQKPPKSRPAYRPIHQYDYPVDERSARGGFLSRHRGGILALVCTIALAGVLGVCGYLLVKSPLMEQLKAMYHPSEKTSAPLAVTQSAAIPETTLPTQEVSTEASLPAQVVSTEASSYVLPTEREAIVPSEVQAAQARVSEFPEQLSRAQTKQTTNENRISNLQRICQALNGRVLQPGDILSFNEAVGERNGENGFKAAPGYSGKSTPEMMGGGTNQGASTLYYCAMLADLEILERSNGEYISAFLDPGMDAAVSWPGPDLKIRNNTDSPIQLLAEADREFVTMEFRSTSYRDYYVKMEYMMTTLYADTIYQDMPSGGSYGDGELIQSGNNGAYVRSFRCKYSKQTDQLLSQELESYSSYPMVSNTVARVIETTPPTETTPETQPPETLPTEAPPTEAPPTEAETQLPIEPEP